MRRRGLWERYVVPRLVRSACSARPVERQREKVVPRATGRVLEIGIGSGLNLPFYDAGNVVAVTGVDPSPELTGDALAQGRGMPFPVTVRTASAEAIPEPDNSFDTAVVTYALCSILDLSAALAEIRRVLVPGGVLLFVEHGEAPDVGVRRVQRLLNPMWKRIGGGCNLHRPIPALLEAAGFVVEDLQALYLPGPRWLNYNYWGLARAA